MATPSLDELNKIAEPILSLNKSLHLGPFIVALVLDTLFCGVMLMQSAAYLKLGMSDRPYLKCVVAYVLAMNIVITVYTWAWMYDLFVYNFGSYGMFLSLKYLSQYYVLDSMTVVVVQAFFAMRVWHVTGRNYFILGLIAICALTAFGGGIGVKIMFVQVGSTLRAGEVKIPAYIWLFATVICDLLITGIILHYLLSSKTGRRSTDHLLSKLARITFESQLPPTLIAVGLAIEYTIKYSSFIAIPFICVQAKFYGISLLHTLNSRQTLKSGNVTAMTDNDGIEFARPAQSTVWMTSRFETTTDDKSRSRAAPGDTHHHTQLTIIPATRPRDAKRCSLDTTPFRDVDLGPNDQVLDIRKRDSSILDPSEVSRFSTEDDPTARPRGSGGETKLASMGMSGGAETGWRRY